MGSQNCANTCATKLCGTPIWCAKACPNFRANTVKRQHIKQTQLVHILAQMLAGILAHKIAMLKHVVAHLCGALPLCRDRYMPRHVGLAHHALSYEPWAFLLLGKKHEHDGNACWPSGCAGQMTDSQRMRLVVGRMSPGARDVAQRAPLL